MTADEDEDKMVDGFTASYLVDTVEALAKLEAVITDLRWRLLLGPSESVLSKAYDVRKARTFAKTINSELTGLLFHLLEDKEEKKKTKAPTLKAMP